MRLFRRREPKPKWSHPCPVCNRAGRVIPHRGQHAVTGPPASMPPMTSLPPAPGTDDATSMACCRKDMSLRHPVGECPYDREGRGMDELLAFIEERLTDHELEVRLNPVDDMFGRPLLGFTEGLRAVLKEYRETLEFTKDCKSDGKTFGDGYMKGLEDAIRRIAVQIWGLYVPHPGFKAEWEHG